MSKAEEKAIAYADNKLQIVDPEFAKSSYLRHNKMGVRLFSGDDIEEAYQDGYYQAEKDNALTWEDIKLIGELFNKQISQYWISFSFWKKCSNCNSVLPDRNQVPFNN